jgi:hypothetical protein
MSIVAPDGTVIVPVALKEALLVQVIGLLIDTLFGAPGADTHGVVTALTALNI